MQDAIMKRVLELVTDGLQSQTEAGLRDALQRTHDLVKEASETPPAVMSTDEEFVLDVLGYSGIIYRGDNCVFIAKREDEFENVLPKIREAIVNVRNDERERFTDAHAGETVGEMGPKRAIYFLQRFKRDEKMLGPHEQWALDYAIATLESFAGLDERVPKYRQPDPLVGALIGAAVALGHAEQKQESAGIQYWETEVQRYRVAITDALKGVATSETRACLNAVREKCTAEEWRAISAMFSEQDEIIKELKNRVRSNTAEVPTMAMVARVEKGAFDTLYTAFSQPVPAGTELYAAIPQSE